MNDGVFNEVLTAGAQWLLAGAAAWSVLICGAAWLEAATAGRLRATSWVGCPPQLRHVLLSALGVALVAAPVQAASTSPGSLPPPARPTGGAPGVAQRIVVRPGDALWRLAERRLRPAAPAAEVAHLVERLHHRNRHVIGPDPDLIRPGQHLVVPTIAAVEARHPTQETP